MAEFAHDSATLGGSVVAVVQVQCVTGCGHRLYSDRGPVECPCHWPVAKAVAVAPALERR